AGEVGFPPIGYLEVIAIGVGKLGRQESVVDFADRKRGAVVVVERPAVGVADECRVAAIRCNECVGARGASNPKIVSCAVGVDENVMRVGAVEVVIDNAPNPERHALTRPSLNGIEYVVGLRSTIDVCSPYIAVVIEIETGGESTPAEVDQRDSKLEVAA